MRRLLVSFACLGFVVYLGLGLHRSRPVAAQQPPELVASTGPRTPEEERKGFHLPRGFEIELVAAEPQINKPMNIAFDDHSRLWVTSTVEYPFPAKEGTHPRDCVKILEDFQPDGRAGKVTTFVDELNIPIGIIPLRGGSEALVHSIPNIYHVVDTDGDGKADQREVFYSQYGFRDTHGMTNSFSWGFDGWIYACHGFSNTSTVKGSDLSPITMNSGNTYRMRPDGSHLEYYTHGQVNPFGLCFDPLGNLYSADCHSKPVYQLVREAYYPSFGKPDDGLGFGPEMVHHDHGSTGIAGVAYYAAEQFPEKWRGTVFIGNVVTSRINHDTIEWHGTSPVGVLQPDFLTSDDPWFRPVNIVLGPDGALYVADFYNKIIGHYEVPLLHPGRDRERGRIWRIVYRGTDPHAKLEAPRSDWTAASVDDLIKDLAHPNLAVRMRATNELSARKGDEIPRAVQAAMRGDSNAWTRAHGLWILMRRGELGQAVIRQCAGDSDATVRVHAMRVLGERSALPGPQLVLAVNGLKDSHPRVQRAAAEALGRHPSSDAVRPLLDLRHAVPADDSHLLHVVRIALRDQFLADSAWSHMPRRLTERDLRAIADVAPGVHTAAAAKFLLDHVQHIHEPDDRLMHYVHHIARYGASGTGESLLAFARGNRPVDLPHQASLLKAIVQGTQERGSKLDEAVESWALELVGKLFDSGQPKNLSAGVDLASSLKLKSLHGRVLELGRSRGAPEPQRSAALHALVEIDPKASIAPLGQILNDAGEPMGVREQATNALAKINQPQSREVLVKSLPNAPGRLQSAIAVALAGGGRDAAEMLLDAVAAGKASARLLQERGVEVRLPGAGIPDLADRIAKLTTGLPPAEERLQHLLNRRRTGFASARTDSAAGSKVFEKVCATCHQLQGKGARIGPQLDGIGVRGADRLLEDILDPNRNVDQQFRSTTLALQNGQVVSGLLLREEGAILVMADSEGKEVRVAKDTVEERKVNPVSPMPANLSDQIAEPDFYNLIAYLLTQQPPKEETEPR